MEYQPGAHSKKWATVFTSRDATAKFNAFSDHRAKRSIIPIAGAMLAFLWSGGALAHPHNDGNFDNATQGHSHTSSSYVHENGIGADPDNDTNPATNTGAISLLGNAAQAADDPPYAVITFEAPPGGHGDKIKNSYKEEFGVTFFPEVSRQLCRGQRHFNYNSLCTYEAAPSGEYAAVYMDYLNRPLIIEFDRPVCVVTMAIYPTGGKQGEPFKLTIEGWTKEGAPLETADIEFEWTKDTVRWRHMAGAFYLDEPASKIAVSMQSKDATQKKEVLRFLIDDLAMVEEGCEEALAGITKADITKAEAGEDDNPAADEAEAGSDEDPVLSVAAADAP